MVPLMMQHVSIQLHASRQLHAFFAGQAHPLVRSSVLSSYGPRLGHMKDASRALISIMLQEVRSFAAAVCTAIVLHMYMRRCLAA